MKHLPRGKKAQIMGTRLFQTMYTADQMRKAIADEREACAEVCENEAKEHERNSYDARDGRYDWQADGANACAVAIRARGNKCHEML